MTTPDGRTSHATDPAEGAEEPGRDNEDMERPHSEDPAEGVDLDERAEPEH
jgi:hypothetical protein